MSSGNAERRAVMRAQLVEGTRKVPIDAFQRWDVQRVRAFKACITKCKRVAANPKATEGEISAQLNELSSFWH